MINKEMIVLQKKLDTPNVNYEKLFLDTAIKLINEYSLEIENCTYQLIELEFYYYDKDKHADPYVHGVKEQQKTGTFYVHKKNGTYGGIDITFYNEDKEIYGGILIRGIRNSKTNEFYSGPNIVKNEISRHLDAINNYEALQSVINKNLYLKKIDSINTKTKIYFSTRIGLSPLPEDYYTKENYIYKMY